MNLEELAWAAGLFDGEGCSYIKKPSGKSINPIISISIHQKHREVLDRFFNIVGEGTIHGNPPHSNQKTYHYQYRVSAIKAHKVMTKIWPFLSIHKKNQYNRCVNYMKDNCIKSNSNKPKFIPDNLP